MLSKVVQEPVWAPPVAGKGADACAVTFMIGVLEAIGYPKLIFQSDSESSIKALKSAVKEASKLNILEASKTGAHRKVLQSWQ